MTRVRARWSATTNSPCACTTSTIQHSEHVPARTEGVRHRDEVQRYIADPRQVPSLLRRPDQRVEDLRRGEKLGVVPLDDAADEGGATRRHVPSASLVSSQKTRTRSLHFEGGNEYGHSRSSPTIRSQHRLPRLHHESCESDADTRTASPASRRYSNVPIVLCGSAVTRWLPMPRARPLSARRYRSRASGLMSRPLPICIWRLGNCPAAEN